MKRVLLLVIISLGIACAQIQAQIYPQYKECVGYYTTGSSGGPLYYNYVDIKVKPNSTLKLYLAAAPFWDGCTNFSWHLNLLNSVTTVYGQDCTVEFKGNNTGWAMVSINAIDKNGYYKNCSFKIEVKN